MRLGEVLEAFGSTFRKGVRVGTTGCRVIYVLRSVNGGAEKDENRQLCSLCDEIHPQKYTHCDKCGKCYHHNQYEERKKHEDGRCNREGRGGTDSRGGGGGGCGGSSSSGGGGGEVDGGGGGGGGEGFGDSRGSGEARGVGGGKDAGGGRMGSGGVGGGGSAGSSSNGGGWGDVMAGSSGNGDGRERHSADPRCLDRHRNNQKMLKIKYKAGRHGRESSGGVAVVGGRVGIDKTRWSGDSREKRLRLLARYNRFQVSETLKLRKQAGASYFEVKRMVAATWRGMSANEKARWDAPASAGANGELAEKRKGSRANRGRRRSVDKVCSETHQVGWLQVSLCVCAHA
jgi:hypothetical protein